MISQEEYRTFYDNDKKIWYGLDEPPFYGKSVSVGRVILNSLNLSPNKISQISHETGVKITNLEQKQKTIRAAIHLKKCGINYGDVIGIVAKNSEHLAPIVFASLTIGAPINPLDAKFIPKDIAHIYNLTKPKIVFCDYDILEKVNEALETIKLKPMIVTLLGKVNEYKFIEEFFSITKDEEDTFVPPIFDNENTLGLISCSSGTTGVSKGVMMSHALILTQIANLTKCNQDDIFTNFSSLYWVSGSGSLIGNTITSTTRIISTELFTPKLFFDILKKYKITYFISSPTEMGLIINSPEFDTADLSTIRQWTCGGALVPEEFQIKVNKKLKNGKIVQCYGMTEMGGIVSANSQSKILNSVGFLAPNIQTKIVNDDGEKLGPTERGEICMKTTFSFMGYSGMSDEVKIIKDNDEFIHSGDIGYFDCENNLFIVGRKKEIIEHFGNHVSPTELENLIIQLDGIAFVCVVGIPDLIAVNHLAAVVIRKENSKITEQEIIDHVAKNMGVYKQLSGGVFFTDSFPLTPSGKMKRNEVAEIAYNMYKNRKQNIN